MANTVCWVASPPVSGNVISVATRVVVGPPATLDGTVGPPDATDDVVSTTVVVVAGNVLAGVVGNVLAGLVVSGTVVGGSALQVTVPWRSTVGESVLVPLGRSICQWTCTLMVTTPVAVIGSITAFCLSTVRTGTGTPLAVTLSMTIV